MDSPTKPDSPSPSSPPRATSDTSLKTPLAPRPNSSFPLLAPNAPAQKPPGKGLPLSTPAANATPLGGKDESDELKRSKGGEGGAFDLAEFDPYAAASTSAVDAAAFGPSSIEQRRLEVRPTAPKDAPSEPLPALTVNPAPATPTPSTAAPGPSQQPPPTRLAERDDAEADAVAAKEPAFNFSAFLKDMKQKSAEPVSRYLKSFLTNFAKKPFTVNEQIKLIHDFLSFISEKMAQVEPWKSQPAPEFDNALEAMEKLVMNRLYNYTFTPQLVVSQPITTDDLERDAVFSQRVRLFGWIREKHLDVPEGEAAQGFLGFAQQELLKINHYKAPRDKMICILNCCKVIFGLIRNAFGPQSGGADAFIPILIFVVLCANPDHLISNLEYIQRFRSSQKLQGETAYYLSSLTGSIQFIETMDASSLSNITQEEFESNVESAIQELPPSPTSETRRLETGQTPKTPRRDRDAGAMASPFAAASPGEEAARPLSMASAQASLEGTRRWFARTGNLAQEAVSRPLGAIGKILETMGPGEGKEAGSESGSESEEGEGRGHEMQGRDRGVATPRDVFGARRFRAVTPESPSRAPPSYLGVDEGISRSGTPVSDILPEFSNLQIQSTIDLSQETYTQTRRANVQTLQQMFPALDEDLVGDVLEGCGDDLGVAIDRLLEM